MKLFKNIQSTSKNNLYHILTAPRRTLIFVSSCARVPKYPKVPWVQNWLGLDQVARLKVCNFLQDGHGATSVTSATSATGGCSEKEWWRFLWKTLYYFAAFLRRLEAKGASWHLVSPAFIGRHASKMRVALLGWKKIFPTTSFFRSCSGSGKVASGMFVGQLFFARKCPSQRPTGTPQIHRGKVTANATAQPSKTRGNPVRFM